MRTAVLAAAFTVAFGGAAAAFECPKHFAEAQALIDKVTADMVKVGAASEAIQPCRAAHITSACN